MKKAISKESCLKGQIKGAKIELVAGDSGMLHCLHLTDLDFHWFYISLEK